MRQLRPPHVAARAAPAAAAGDRVSWTRKGDNARSHPVMQRAATLGDERTPLEFFGFLAMAYEYSGEHTTDYVVPLAALWSFCGGDRAYAGRLLDIAQRVKVAEPAQDEEGFPAFQFMADPDFFHIITKAQKEWKLQQRNDTRDTGLTSRVRLRDGDACRWCAKLVMFGNTRGHNGGAYNRADMLGEIDHIKRSPATPETLVVACLECNRARGNPEASQADWKLLPPPTHPYYSQRTAEFLTNNGFPTKPSDPPATRPTADTAHPATRQQPDTAAASDPAEPDTAPLSDVTPSDATPPDGYSGYTAGTGSVKTRSAGSGLGRGGSSRTGTQDDEGQDEGPEPRPDRKPRRRRSRRGRPR